MLSLKTDRVFSVFFNYLKSAEDIKGNVFQ